MSKNNSHGLLSSPKVFNNTILNKYRNLLPDPFDIYYYFENYI